MTNARIALPLLVLLGVVGGLVFSGPTATACLAVAAVAAVAWVAVEVCTRRA